MVEYRIAPAEAAVMIATGFAVRGRDGAMELTPKGVAWTMAYLNRGAS